MRLSCRCVVSCVVSVRRACLVVCSPRIAVDSFDPFSTPNYKMTTTARIEWWYVEDPEKGLKEMRIDSWPVEAPETITVPTRGSNLTIPGPTSHHPWCHLSPSLVPPHHP
jgi:hypothetical protein